MVESPGVQAKNLLAEQGRVETALRPVRINGLAREPARPWNWNFC
jgi:hypothetical protein